MTTASRLIQKSIEVSLGVEDAFRVWTEKMDLWWPKHGHTRSGTTATTLVMERWAGGRLFERTDQGQEFEWGTVVVWEPPERLVYTWFLGADETRPTEIEVRFAAEGLETTRILVEQRMLRLEPSHWDRRAPGFRRAWDEVLHAFRSTSEQAH